MRDVVKIVNRLRKKTVAEDLAQRSRMVNQIGRLKIQVKRITDIVLDEEQDIDRVSRINLLNEQGEKLREIQALQEKISYTDALEYVPEPEEVILKAIKGFRQVFDQQDNNLKTEFLKSFVSKIEVNGEEIRITYEAPIPDAECCLTDLSYGKCSCR